MGIRGKSVHSNEIPIKIFIRTSSGSPKTAKSAKSSPAGLRISEISRNHQKLSDPGGRKIGFRDQKIGAIIFGGLDAFEVAESEYFGILHRS